ncbi:MAG: CotH kinase family protein [Bacteroidota bacterium]
MKRFIFPATSYFVFASLLLLSAGRLTAQVNFTYHSSYSYLKGSEAQSLSASWMQPSFDYSSWTPGTAPFHYGDGTGGVELTDMLNNYTTLYLRTTFTCSGAELIDYLVFTVDYDDGFIVWINGVQALTVNAPANPAWNSLAPDNHESGTGVDFQVATGTLNLSEGTNYIAVQAFNVSSTSTDFYFDMAILGERDIPEYVPTAPIVFSQPSGFYDDPFSLTVSCADAGVSLVYTLDGSNPQNSVNSYTSASPAGLTIDPASTAGRPATPGVVVRVSAFKDGYKPSKPVAASYIYIEKVKTQGNPGGEWPTYNINGQSIDLAMDSKVVNATAYSGLIDDALLDIPTISVVTDLKNLFDPASGIYVNAEGHGLNWEKECSVELINPDGSEGFMVNAGLRIRGGWSRHDDFPKHSFRLFFREEYGNAKLEYPLFGEEGTDSYDKIDLRTSQNYAWANGSYNNTMVREVFSRDSQRDLGQPYTRSRYYHLYINGMYWGLYQTQERSEARFAESYFGGNVDDYDVVKVNTENYSYQIEATDGSLDKWRKIWNMAQAGFDTDKEYFLLEGKDEYGVPIPGGEVLVDIGNLIDYMLVIFYTGNFDAPTSSFGSNKGCNNFYAIDNRYDKSTGYTFYAHDSEHAMFNEAQSPGVGLYEDRVNLAERTDNYTMEVWDFAQFHPQWLHHKLCSNAEYRIRFASRASQVFGEGGVLAPAANLERLNTRVDEINVAIIAESARWGDAKNSNYAYNRNDQWTPEIQKIRTQFIPQRTNIVIGQLQEADLYPSIKSPVAKVAGEKVLVPVKYFDGSLALSLENPNGSGTICYTIDGSDPRNTGGEAVSSATEVTASTTLTVEGSLLLRARIRNNQYWSGMYEVMLIRNNEDYSKLKVTELHYHPEDWIVGSDTTDGQDLEFIELKNTGEQALSLAGLILDSAVHYTFPAGALIYPHKFWVIASNPPEFYNFYKKVASGNYSGHFSNGGEQVLLNDPEGISIFNFTYMDLPPWPAAADGTGKSLCSVQADPTGDPASYTYWTVSAETGGNPFADNFGTATHPEPAVPNGQLTAWPNPTDDFVSLHLSQAEEYVPLDLAVFNLTGTTVYRATLDNGAGLSLRSLGLEPGLYLIRVGAEGFSGTVRVILR